MLYVVNQAFWHLYRLLYFTLLLAGSSSSSCN
jgi:hypothetical protein